LYQARALYQGRSAGSQHTHWPLHHLFLASICSLLAGIVGGLLGTGSGFVMGPLFLEVGIVPQVSSHTAFTFTLFLSIYKLKYRGGKVERRKIMEIKPKKNESDLDLYKEFTLFSIKNLKTNL